MITCKDKYHEDEFENGKLVPLRREDMIGRYCVGCHEARMDTLEEYCANQADFDLPDAHPFIP